MQTAEHECAPQIDHLYMKKYCPQVVKKICKNLYKKYVSSSSDFEGINGGKFVINHSLCQTKTRKKKKKTDLQYRVLSMHIELVMKETCYIISLFLHCLRRMMGLGNSSIVACA